MGQVDLKAVAGIVALLVVGVLVYVGKVSPDMLAGLLLLASPSPVFSPPPKTLVVKGSP